MAIKKKSEDEIAAVAKRVADEIFEKAILRTPSYQREIILKVLDSVCSVAAELNHDDITVAVRSAIDCELHH